MACKKCGECCKWIYIRAYEPLILKEIDKLRGMELVNPLMVRAPVFCRLFNQETGLCGDYENRPIECKKYPVPIDVRPPECKYEETD